MTNLFTADELEELCLTPLTRVERALQKDDLAPAGDLVVELTGVMRGYCGAFLDWLVHTDEYVTSELGHDYHLRATRPERVAELASRTGLTLEDLVHGQSLLDGDSELESRVIGAIADGDAATALDSWKGCERLFRQMHDFRRDLLSDLAGWIHAEFGVTGLEAAFRYAGEHGWWRRAIPEDIALAPEDRLKSLVYPLTVGGFFEMAITEHDDHWLIHLLVCGNCGRQVDDCYQKDGWRLRTVDEPGPLTFGLPSVTIYQSHLAVLHQMYSAELVGAPWPAIECAGLQASSRPCKLFVYKDPMNTPAKFYERVGLIRPDARAGG